MSTATHRELNLRRRSNRRKATRVNSSDKPRPPMLTFRGTRWSVVRTNLLPGIRGQCDSPRSSRRKITLNERLERPEEILEVLIHECLHGLEWSATEEWVDRTAVELARALHRLGAQIDLSRVPFVALHSEGNK